MEGSSGVLKKRAWTEEEDKLLRICVEKYGEGNWRKVPLRAGLNRCRKSCRLRWLNYVKPNINRGKFSEDEVDLIIRLHKLLGNRWSLIAGRLPGRTANDVKNYWNTSLCKKIVSCKEDVNPKITQKRTKTNVIKPRPRIFSKNLYWLGRETSIVNNVSQLGGNFCQESVELPPLANESIWWESLMDDKEINQTNTFAICGPEEETTTGLFVEENAPGTMLRDIFHDEGHNYWNDFPFDVELWSLFNAEQETRIDGYL